MTQQQIKGVTGSLGSGGSLDVYDVPGSVIVTPYSVSATFDGSGAGGAFLPCLTFKTQTGAVIARCPAPEVASGDTAEVSWFPHVAAAGGSAPTVTNAEWFYVNRSTTFTMLAGNQDTIPWSSLHSSDSSLFSLATVDHTNDAVQVARQGVLMVSSYLLPTAIGTDFVVGINNNLIGFGVIGEDTQTPEVQFNRDGLPGGGSFGPRDISIMAMSSVPQQIVAEYHNFDAANRVLNGAQMAGLWWPTGTLIT